VPTHTHTLKHINTHTHTHTPTQCRLRQQKVLEVFAGTATCADTRTLTHTHTHTFARTHTHTHAGYTNEKSWRCSLALPPVLLLASGIGIWFLTDDCPLGVLQRVACISMYSVLQCVLQHVAFCSRAASAFGSSPMTAPSGCCSVLQCLFCVCTAAHK